MKKSTLQILILINASTLFAMESEVDSTELGTQFVNCSETIHRVNIDTVDLVEQKIRQSKKITDSEKQSSLNGEITALIDETVDLGSSYQSEDTRQTFRNFNQIHRRQDTVNFLRRFCPCIPLYMLYQIIRFFY